jgi:hypothetical protein
VERENIAWHVSELGNCPNALVCCPFKDSGCNIKEKRHQLGKHLSESVVDHQLKQQQKLSQLLNEKKELKQDLASNEDQCLLKQLRDENAELKEKLVAFGEQQLRHEQVISQLQRRLLADGGGLDSLMWHSLGFEPSHDIMLSRCGRALLRLDVKGISMPYSSTPFLAHQSGYMAKINVTIEKEGSSWLAKKHLHISLMPTIGSNDDKLAWPFKIRYTIVLVDQRDFGLNIRKTIDPERLDGSLVEFCFGAPSVLRIANSMLNMVPSMLCVSWPPSSWASSSCYVRNNVIIIYVEVDN